MAAQKRLTEKYDPDGDAELTVTFTEEDGDTLEVPTTVMIQTTMQQ